MRIVKFKCKVKPKLKFKRFKTKSTEALINFITKKPLTIGFLKLVKGKVEILDGNFKYIIYDSEVRNKYVLFIGSSKCIIKLDGESLNPNLENRENFKIVDLGDPCLGIGSWICLGRIGCSLEIWPITIKNPYIYIFRFWSTYYNKQKIQFGDKHRFELEIPLKIHYGIKISNSYLVYTCDDYPYIGYKHVKYNILKLLE